MSATVARLYDPMMRPFHAHGTHAGLHRLRTLSVLEAELAIAKREYVNMARGRDKFSPPDQVPATWETIGDALGITKQAAQQFYSSTLTW